MLADDEKRSRQWTCQQCPDCPKSNPRTTSCCFRNSATGATSSSPRLTSNSATDGKFVLQQGECVLQICDRADDLPIVFLQHVLEIHRDRKLILDD